MIETITITHDCVVGCSKCYGTGQGWYSNSCTMCNGTGVLYGRGEVEEEFEVEWRAPDLSDLKVTNGYHICPECDENLLDLIIEELTWKTTN
jgi:DnaJ-class molecular chaperone